MLPPMRAGPSRTQMGDILSWAGGREHSRPPVRHNLNELYRPPSQPSNPSPQDYAAQKQSSRGASPQADVPEIAHPSRGGRRYKVAADTGGGGAEGSKYYDGYEKHDSSQAGYVRQLEQRVSNISGQLDARARTDAELIRRLQMQVRELQDGLKSVTSEMGTKVYQLTEKEASKDREIAVLKETVKTLQNEFRDYSVESVYRQRAEIQGEVKNNVTKYQFENHEWQVEVRKVLQTLAEEQKKLSEADTRVEDSFAAFKGDIRTRLSALEASVLGSGGKNQTNIGIGNGLSREQLEHIWAELRQAVKDISGLQLEQEAQKQVQISFAGECQQRIEALKDSVERGKEETLIMMDQKSELMEAKLGVERQEMQSKMQSVKEELEANDQMIQMLVVDLEVKTSQKMDLLKKCEEAERDALREVVDTKLNQVCGQIARTENLRQDGLTNLYEKMEGFQSKQLETVKGIREEVQDNIKDIQILFKDEMRHRMETERKITDSITDVVKNLTATQTASFEQLSGKLVVLDKALQESRKEGGERADRISRYVDDIVSRWRQDASLKNEVYDNNFAQMHERIVDIVGNVERVRAWFDDKNALTEKNLEDKARNLEEKIRSGLDGERKRCENRLQTAENEAAAGIARVRDRCERVNKEMDEGFQGVHRAVLGLSKDKSLIGAQIVVPLPSWDKVSKEGKDNDLPVMTDEETLKEGADRFDEAGGEIMLNMKEPTEGDRDWSDPEALEREAERSEREQNLELADTLALSKTFNDEGNLKLDTEGINSEEPATARSLISNDCAKENFGAKENTPDNYNTREDELPREDMSPFEGTADLVPLQPSYQSFGAEASAGASILANSQAHDEEPKEMSPEKDVEAANEDENGEDDDGGGLNRVMDLKGLLGTGGEAEEAAEEQEDENERDELQATNKLEVAEQP